MTRATSLLFLASIAILGVGTAIFVEYQRDISRARSAALQGGQVAVTTFGPVEYAETGTGFPLLWIHGAGGGFDQGLANAADLIGKGYRVIAPSRFGYLATPIPADAGPAAQADAHEALLHKLQVEKAIVVGVSAGARSAIELALRYPGKVEALVLIVPATYAPGSPVSIDASRGSRLALRLVNAGADFLWWVLERIAPDVLIRFIGVPPTLVATAPKTDQDRVIGMVRSIQPLSQRFPGINIDSNPELKRRPLENVAARTLIISARDDLFNTLPAAEYAAGLIPNAKLVVFETGGHLLVGRQEAVRRLIGKFIGAPSAGFESP